MKIMKRLKSFTVAVLLTSFVAGPFAALAADAKADKKSDKAKPYPLDTCIVSDEKIGADPNMKPYAFTQDGREIKLCCKGCLKDFNKDKAKYLKKLEAAEKKAK
jgi:hypothetical protein